MISNLVIYIIHVDSMTLASFRYNCQDASIINTMRVLSAISHCDMIGWDILNVCILIKNWIVFVCTDKDEFKNEHVSPWDTYSRL